LAKNTYDSKAIEVLSGLDPVRKRPGMYTDTSCPNHLIQEVLDNAVDEAIAGHCSNIKIKLHKNGVIEVSDDGRGMPVDIHPDHKLSGVELILCKLHAGAKFSGDEYSFSGGLHGVGVSVVNALSENLQVNVKRDSKEHEMHFDNGNKKSDLKLSEIKRKIIITDYNSKIPFLFDKLLKEREHISLVKDKKGAIKGLVTLEDILETILGLEIVDETDKVEDLQAFAKKYNGT